MNFGILPAEVLQQIFQNVPQRILSYVWFQMDDSNPLRQMVASQMVVRFPDYGYDDPYGGFLLYSQQKSLNRFKELTIDLEVFVEYGFGQLMELCNQNTEFLSSFQNIRFEGRAGRYIPLASIFPKDPVRCLSLRVDKALKREHIPQGLETVSLSFVMETDIQHDIQLFQSLDNLVDLQLRFESDPNFDLVGIEWPKRLKKLNLLNTNLATLSEVALPESIEYLTVNARLTTLEGTVFPSSLKELDLSMNMLEVLEGAVFPELLRKLLVHDNYIEVVKENDLPSGLLDLDLLWNSSLETRDSTFPSLLQKLNLRGCDVQSLADLNLPDLLEELILNDNAIQNLNDWSFPSQLKKFELRWNPIQLLENVIFPMGLLDLDLSRNFTGDKTLKMNGAVFPNLLERLDLTECGVKTLREINLPSLLRSLILHDNYIENLDDWIIPSQLEELELVVKGLVEFPNINLPNLKSLDLSFYEASLTYQVGRRKGRLRKLAKIKLPASLETLIVAHQPVKDWTQVVFPPNLTTLKLAFMEDPALLNLPLSLTYLALSFGEHAKPGFNYTDIRLPLSLLSLDLIFPEDSKSNYIDLRLPQGLLQLSLENGISSEFDWPLPSLVKFEARLFTGPIKPPSRALNIKISSKSDFSAMFGEPNIGMDVIDSGIDSYGESDSD